MLIFILQVKFSKCIAGIMPNDSSNLATQGKENL